MAKNILLSSETIFKVFAGKPERMLLISLAFAAFYVLLSVVEKKFLKHWPLLAALLLWLLFFVWESRSVGHNSPIRIDLFVLLPLSMVLSICLIAVEVILIWRSIKKLSKYRAEHYCL